MHSFFERLEELRNIKGLSQPAMARILGINQSTYNRNARGETLPSSDSLCKLALHFSSEQIYYLLTGTKPDTMQLSIGKEEEEREWINRFRALSDKKRAAYLESMRPDDGDNGP